MTLLVSTHFKERLIAQFPLLFNGGAIEIYTGTRPASPDLPAPSAPIGMITLNGLPWSPFSAGYGLNFVADGAFAINDSRQPWLLMPNDLAAFGPASWWRLLAPFDSGLASIGEARLDGEVGHLSAPAGEEILLPSTTLIPGTAVPVTAFVYTIPPIIGV